LMSSAGSEVASSSHCLQSNLTLRGTETGTGSTTRAAYLRGFISRGFWVFQMNDLRTKSINSRKQPFVGGMMGVGQDVFEFNNWKYIVRTMDYGRT
jgi:hypothetical protein